MDPFQMLNLYSPPHFFNLEMLLATDVFNGASNKECISNGLNSPLRELCMHVWVDVRLYFSLNPQSLMYILPSLTPYVLNKKGISSTQKCTHLSWPESARFTPNQCHSLHFFVNQIEFFPLSKMWNILKCALLILSAKSNIV